MKINIERKEQLEAALKEAQGRATARTIDVDRILGVLKYVEERLGIGKTALKGTKVHFTGAEKFAKAYRYIPESTHFEAVHSGKTWFATSITRDTCPNRWDKIDVELSDITKAAVLKSLSRM